MFTSRLSSSIPTPPRTIFILCPHFSSLPSGRTKVVSEKLQRTHVIRALTLCPLTSLILDVAAAGKEDHNIALIAHSAILHRRLVTYTTWTVAFAGIPSFVKTSPFSSLLLAERYFPPTFGAC